MTEVNSSLIIRSSNQNSLINLDQNYITRELVVEGVPGPAGPTGSISFDRYLGDYNPDTTYAIADVVYYDGFVYITSTESLNEQPDLNSNWNPLNIETIEGPQGPTGAAGSVGPRGPKGIAGPVGNFDPQLWRDNYSATQTYAKNRIVLYNNTMYISRIYPNLGNQPNISPDAWYPIAMTGPQGDPGPAVTILGSYNTLVDLQTAHPTGNVGDSYLVSGDLYAWFSSQWNNVGTIQGPQGVAGVAGADGVDGAIGPQGPMGPQGLVGPKGDTGATGATGAASTVPGPQGEIGPAGPAGAASTVPGPQGPAGADGATGPQGPAGPQGDPGPQGPAGAGGATGATGATGPAGPGDVSFQEYTDSATLALTDAHKMVQANKATAMNITIPPSGTTNFNVGTSIAVIQLGAGQVTVVAGSGVTIYNASTLKTRAQYSILSLTKAATDTWYVAGDME
jgi:hypothetical protein